MGPLFILLLAFAGAGGKEILGLWNCVASDARGAETHWTLEIKQDSGRLAATLRAVDGYVIPLKDATFENDRLSFSFGVNPNESIEVLLTLAGDRLEGRWAGTNTGVGLFKGARAGALDVSGAWTGVWDRDPDGKTLTAHHMVLKQEGEAVTGTAGPAPDQQLPISNGRLAGNKLTFEIAIPYGPRLAFAFTVERDTMTGAAVLTMNGGQRKLELAAKRSAR